MISKWKWWVLHWNFVFSMRYEWIDMITFVSTHFYTIRDDVLSLPTGWVCLVYHTTHKKMFFVTTSLYHNAGRFRGNWDFSIRYEWIDMITFVPAHFYIFRYDVLSLPTGWFCLVYHATPPPLKVCDAMIFTWSHVEVLHGNLVFWIRCGWINMITLFPLTFIPLKIMFSPSNWVGICIWFTIQHTETWLRFVMVCDVMISQCWPFWWKLRFTNDVWNNWLLYICSHSCVYH